MNDQVDELFVPDRGKYDPTLDGINGWLRFFIAVYILEVFAVWPILFFDIAPSRLLIMNQNPAQLFSVSTVIQIWFVYAIFAITLFIKRRKTGFIHVSIVIGSRICFFIIFILFAKGGLAAIALIRIIEDLVIVRYLYGSRRVLWTIEFREKVDSYLTAQLNALEPTNELEGSLSIDDALIQMRRNRATLLDGNRFRTPNAYGSIYEILKARNGKYLLRSGYIARQN